MNSRTAAIIMMLILTIAPGGAMAALVMILFSLFGRREDILPTPAVIALFLACWALAIWLFIRFRIVG